jgi:hypothetical protein
LATVEDTAVAVIMVVAGTVTAIILDGSMKVQKY